MSRLIGLLAVILVVTACADASTSPRPSKMHPLASEVDYEDPAVGDSVPAACQYFNCKSLEPAEKTEMLGDLYGALTAAGNANDMPCFELFVSAHSKVSSNKVYHALALRLDPAGRPITAAYNRGGGEMYIRTNGFASKVDLYNRVSHETAHGMGFRDDVGPPPFAQDFANYCSIYIGG